MLQNDTDINPVRSIHYSETLKPERLNFSRLSKKVLDKNEPMLRCRKKLLHLEK